MIVTPQIFIAGRCPHCQEYILYRPLSLFSLRDGKTRELYCGCGSKAFEIRYSGKKYLYFDVFCIYCAEKHSYIYSLGEVVKEFAISLTCGETDLHLAYIGQKQPVLKAMDEEGAIIMDYADELTDYFACPSIMAKSLIQINKLFAQDAVNCSNCEGGSYNVLVQSQRISISCNDCGSHVWVSARRPSDLMMLNKVTRITIAENQAYFKFATGENLNSKQKKK